MYGSWNSYVVTSIIVSRQCFLCSFFKLMSRPSFYVTTAFLFGSCYNNVSCIVSISVATRKVCRDRVLSPLNLISCCIFILILRHSLLVLSMFAITTKFLCHDRTFLYSSYICVATQFIMSRQDLSSLCWNLCRDIEKSVNHNPNRKEYEVS